MAGAQESLGSCDKILKDKYKGPALSPKETEELERLTRDKLDKLIAAIARLAAAHADPNNIDYAAAYSAVTTIKELVPGLANGAQALSAVKDDKDRTSVIREMQELLDATCMICRSIDANNLQKTQEGTNYFAKKAKRLQSMLGQADGPAAAPRDCKQQQFANTLSGVQETLDSCEKILREPGLRMLVPVDRPLWASLGELNAAIARLVKATKDENRDYEAAEAAIANIACSMPDIVKEARRTLSNRLAKREEICADTKALCDAVRALTLNINHGEDTSKAIADYVCASGKLTYLFDKYALQKREHELIKFAKDAQETTSEMLPYVYGVADEFRGAAGYDLHVAGAKVAESAEDLLVAVQLTAPTIHTAPSKRLVLDSIDELTSALDNIAWAWSAACKSQVDKEKLNMLKMQSDMDRRLIIEVIRKTPEPEFKIMNVLQPLPIYIYPDIPSLANSLQNERSYLLASLSNSHQVINKPLSLELPSPAEVKERRQSLANKLARLNAAIAGMVVAAYAGDPSSIKYVKAELCMEDIRRLVPEVVHDVRVLNSGKDDAGTCAPMEDLKFLYATTKELARRILDENPAVLDMAVAQYAAAARKLAFTCTPAPLEQYNQEQVLNETQIVLNRSSSMLAAADKLTENHPREAPKVKRAASVLLGTAQMTAPTLNTPQCQSVLRQAVADLSEAIELLDQVTCKLLGGDFLEQQRKSFDEAVKQLMATIEEMKEDSLQLKAMAAEKEKNRLKFIASRLAAQEALENAEHELKKTRKVAPLALPQAAQIQSRLADRLVTLNAAIASLLTATRVPENPDYVLAESATATIPDIVPDLFNDAKTLLSGKDQTARSELLEQLQELCDATKAINSRENTGKEKELQDAVDKFTKASGKLVYTFNPSANAAKEDQIMHLTSSTCRKTSELLGRVYELAQGVDPEATFDLDAQRSRLTDAAQNLLTTAEITAPCISSPFCQSSLLTSISALSSSVDHLFSFLVLTSPQHAAKRQHLQEARAKLDQEIGRLKEALKDNRVLDIIAIEKEKIDKLRFIASIASAEVAIYNAEKEITEPYGKPLPESVAASLKESLKYRLASLDAATNSLVMATSDRSNPDYLEAEAVSKTIRELIPDIVKDSKCLSSTKDQKDRKELLEQIKALCEATRKLGVSAKSDQLSPEELKEAATQYSLASGKLNFVFNPHADQKKTHEIIDTCKSACIKTSEMLHRVHELAKQMPDADGAPLDSKGAQVSDVARSLLITAQLTAHSVHSPRCQAALLDASDRLSSSVQELQATWTPLVKTPKFKASGEQFTKDRDAVEADIMTLRGLVKGIPNGQQAGLIEGAIEEDELRDK